MTTLIDNSYINSKQFTKSNYIPFQNKIGISQGYTIDRPIYEGVIDDGSFSTANYIPLDGSAGIYPAYENALRSATSFTNTVSQDLLNGKFTINVPTGSDRALLNIPISIIPQGRDYDWYYKLNKPVNFIAGTNDTWDRWFSKVNNPTEGVVTLNNPYASSTISRLVIYVGESLDTDIDIEFTLVPKSYPKIQSWAGSQITKTLDSGVKSVSFSVGDYYKNSTAWISPLALTNSWNQSLFNVTGAGYIDDFWKENVFLRVYRVVGGFSTSYYKEIKYKPNIEDVITFNTTSTKRQIFINSTLMLEGECLPDVNNDMSSMQTGAAPTMGIKISQLVTSTLEYQGEPIAIPPLGDDSILSFDGSELIKTFADNEREISFDLKSYKAAWSSVSSFIVLKNKDDMKIMDIKSVSMSSSSININLYKNGNIQTTINHTLLENDVFRVKSDLKSTYLYINDILVYSYLYAPVFGNISLIPLTGVSYAISQMRVFLLDAVTGPAPKPSPMTYTGDLQLSINADGDWDITYENGQPYMTDGFDTCVLLAVFTEPDNWQNEIANNLSEKYISDFPNVIANARVNNQTVNNGIQALRNALKFLLTENIAKQINVTGSILNVNAISWVINIDRFEGSRKYSINWDKGVINANTTNT